MRPAISDASPDGRPLHRLQPAPGTKLPGVAPAAQPVATSHALPRRGRRAAPPARRRVDRAGARLRVLRRGGLGRARALLLWTMMRLVKFNVVEDICKERSFGDWLVLYQLAKNLDPLASRELAARCKPNFPSANGIDSGKCLIQSHAVADTAF